MLSIAGLWEMVNFSRKQTCFLTLIFFIFEKVDIVSVFKVQLEIAYSRGFQKVVKLNFL